MRIACFYETRVEGPEPWRRIRSELPSAVRATWHCADDRTTRFDAALRLLRGRPRNERVRARSAFAFKTLVSATSAFSRLGRRFALDGAVFGSLDTAMWLTWGLERIPSLLNLEATPEQLHEEARLAGDWLKTGPHLWKEDAAATATLAAARRILARSQWAADSAVKKYEVPEERILVLRPGVDLSNLVPVGSAARASPRILFAAYSQSWARGGDVVLDGLGGPASPPVGIDYVGEAPPLTGRHIVPHGEIARGDPRLPGLFAGASVFVFPARSVLYPWEILDAMSAGLPIVTTRVGPIPEIVGEGEGDACAVLVPEGSPDELAAAVSALMSDASRREAMGRAARRRVERLFNMRAYARAFATEISSLTRGG